MIMSSFFDNIDRFVDDYFVPTEADVLRCRVRSTGIEEAQFLFDGLQFTYELIIIMFRVVVMISMILCG